MLEHLSPLQFITKSDGTMALKHYPQITLQTVEGQGRVTGRDWISELHLPRSSRDLEALARASGMSARGLQFVLMDESPTRLPGHPRLRPEQITLPTFGCQLEFGHLGFIIGVVGLFVLRSPKVPSSEEPEQLRSIEPFSMPFTPDGHFVLAQAWLYNSPLAEAAWLGITRGIFTHVCPVVFRSSDAPADSGTLVQVSLVPGDFPGCANARVLRRWEESGG